MPRFTQAEYETLARPRYGTRNPERITNPLWEEAIARGWSAYELRQSYRDRRPADPERRVVSADRERAAGPVWSWSRIGRTETLLEDGRRVFVGGEYEDYYDPDFCIFNDVVVMHPDGRVDIYGYPKGLFPPTDFHTATLVGDDICLVGSVGYKDLRVAGVTQVVRLDKRTFAMRPVATEGDGPGWIASHEAEYEGGETLRVVGGRVMRIGAGKDGAPVMTFEPSNGVFELDIARASWRRVPVGDRAILDISPEDYVRWRAPAHGRANPERITNPFREAMVGRGWTPKRARLHFGEVRGAVDGEPVAARVGQLAAIEDVVWTARRADAPVVVLDDGRRLTIGGEYSSHDTDRGDGWVYNDIIVEHADGRVEVFGYPADAVPPLMRPAVVRAGGRLLVFGAVSYREPMAYTSMAYELDTLTMEMQLLDIGPVRPVMLTHDGPRYQSEEAIGFELVRQTQGDPRRMRMFDLATLSWRDGDAPVPASR